MSWLGITVAAFSYFINNRLVSFDANEKLAAVDHQQLAKSLTQYAELGTNTVLHFSQPNCQCQQYSTAHIQDLTKLAKSNNFNVKNITINQHALLPATPSVAILDSVGNVVYFGPYGEGLACSQTSGYAQTILNNFVKGFAANLVIKSAQGCYCEVS